MDGPNSQSQSTHTRSSLARRFQNGEEAAFDEVVAQYEPAVRQMIYRLLGSGSDCEDLVQDVFVAALAHRRKFRAKASLKTWLFAITINRCRSYRRKQAVWSIFRRTLAMHERVYESQAESELLEAVRRAVRQLPPKYRDVIVLKYMEELPTPEIVKILNIRENTYHTRLNRARNRLRELLKQDVTENE